MSVAALPGDNVINRTPWLRADASAARRLMVARQNAGYPSALAFAKKIGVNATTYYHHENGRRTILPDAAETYARALNIDANVLLFGTELPLWRDIPIVGTIDRGGIVRPMPDTSVPEGLTVDLRGLVTHQVIGNDAYPSIRHGDSVVHRPLTRGLLDLDRIHGCECIIETDEGEVLLRQVEVQRDGLVTLFCYNQPPARNVKLRAAEPIEFIKRFLPGLPGRQGFV